MNTNARFLMKRDAVPNVSKLASPFPTYGKQQIISEKRTSMFVSDVPLTSDIRAHNAVAVATSPAITATNGSNRLNLSNSKCALTKSDDVDDLMMTILW